MDSSPTYPSIRKGTLLLIDCVKAMVFSAAKDSNSFSPLTKNLREYLNFPTSITTDNRGTIYIVDREWERHRHSWTGWFFSGAAVEHGLE